MGNIPTGLELVPTYPQRADGTPGAVVELLTTQAIANLSLGGGGSSLSVVGLTASGRFGTGQIPANGFVLYALLREVNGDGVSLGIGSMPGETDVLPLQSIAGHGTLTVAITAFSKGWFSATVPQTLYLSSPNWNGAAINALLVFQVGP